MAAVSSFMAVIAIASSAYQVYQQKKARKKAKNAEEARKGFELTIEGEVSNVPLIYGRARIGGIRVFSGTSSSFYYAQPNADSSIVVGSAGTAASFRNEFKYDLATDSFIEVQREWPGAAPSSLTTTVLGDRNEFLYTQQVLCAGPIKGVKDIIFDDSRYSDDPSLVSSDTEDGVFVAGAKPRAAFRVDIHNGATRKADSIIGNNIASRASATFPECAYMSAVIRIDRDDPQFNGVPDIQAFVEGRLVPYFADGSDYLARDAQGNLLLRYSTLAPLCLLDYLLDKRHGRGLDISEIHEPSFASAARVAAKIVMRSATVGGRVWGAENGVRRDIPLYEVCMVVDTSRPIRDNIEDMLDTMGDARLVWSQGRYALSLQYPETNDAIFVAGEITDDDIVDGEEIEIIEPSAEDRFNFATIKFNDEARDFKESSVSWPPKTAGTIHDKIGGRYFAQAKGGWSGASEAARLLNSRAVWSSTSNVMSERWKLSFEKAGSYTIKVAADDQATVFCMGVSLSVTHWERMVTGRFTVGKDEVGALIADVMEGGGSLKGFAFSIVEDATGVEVWSSRSASYEAIEIRQQTSGVYDTYLAADFNVPLEYSGQIQGISDYYHALAKAEEVVRMSRTAAAITLKIFVGDRLYESGDFVKINSATVEVDTLYMRVDSVRFEGEQIMVLSGTRFDYTQLAWNVADDQAAEPVPVFAAPIAPPLSLVMQGTQLAWDNSPDTRVVDYVLYSHTTDDNDVSGAPVFLEIGRAPVGPFPIPESVARGATFGIRARAGNGKMSVMIVSASYAIAKGPQPPAPTNLSLVSSQEVAEVVVNYTIPLLRDDGSPYDDHSEVLVYRSRVNLASTADFLASSSGGIFTDLSARTQTMYYWVASRSLRNMQSSLAYAGSANFRQEVIDLTPPPRVEGLKLTGMFTGAMAEWTPAAYAQGGGHATTIIYAAEGHNASFADAAEVADSYSGPVSFFKPSKTVWTVWAKHKTIGGVLSTEPSEARVVEIGEHPDDVLAALAGQIGQDQFIQSFNERIELIDGEGTGSVNQRLRDEAAETLRLLGQERTDRLQEIAQERVVRARETAEERQARIDGLNLEAQTRSAGLAAQAEALGNAVETVTEQWKEGDAALSQRVDVVSATNLSRPNLVAGFQSWTYSSDFLVIDSTWGEALYTWANGTHTAISPRIDTSPGIGYVLSYDSLRYANSGSTYIDLQYFDANDNFVGESLEVFRRDHHDFREDDANRVKNSFYSVTPANVAFIRIRAVAEDMAGVTAIGWRQIKFERGVMPATRFTNEAELIRATALVRDETTARISGDSAQAQRTTDLAVQLRGNSTSGNLADISSGLIAQEMAVRAEKDNALAEQMALLSAGVGEQFDTADIWYFDTNNDSEGWQGRGSLSVSNGFLRIPDSTGWANLYSPASLGIPADTFRQVRMRIRKHGNPVWVGSMMWKNVASDEFNNARIAYANEPEYNINGIALLSWSPEWAGSIYQINFDVFREQQPGGWFEIDWVAVGRPSPGASVASVLDEASARATGDSAQAIKTETLAASLTGRADPSGLGLGDLTSGLLVQERDARVSDIAAQVTARQALSAAMVQGFNNSAADLVEERRVRTEADNAQVESTNEMRARLSVRRNMAPDVFEWAPNVHAGWEIREIADWGVGIFCNKPGSVTLVGSIEGPRVACQPNTPYTISGDTLLRSATGHVCLNMIFRDAAGNTVLDSPSRARGTGHDFLFDDAGRRLTEVHALAPATAVTVAPRFWWDQVSGLDVIGFRQIKLEKGWLPSTQYSTEKETQTLNANIVEESWIRAQEDEALAYQHNQLKAAYDANNVTVYGKIDDESATRAREDGALATRITNVSASLTSRPNLLFNGGFEFGMQEWVGDTTGWWVTDDAWGRSLVNTSIWGTGTLFGRTIPAFAGWVYTVACDTRLYAGSGHVYVDLQFVDASGNLLKDGANQRRFATHDFSNNGDGRRLIEVEDLAPPGTTGIRTRLVWEGIDGLTLVGFRQIKVEIGGLPSSLYTTEGSSIGAVAKIVAESTASVERDNAEALRRSELESKVNLNDHNTNARITDESWTRAQADEAQTYQLNQFKSAYDNNNHTIYGQIADEAATRAREDGALATRLSTVSASLSSRPNLLFNGGFEFGLQDWTGSTPSWYVVDDAWGRSITSTGLWGTGALISRPIPAFPGWTYTIACDSRLYAGQGFLYVDLQFYNDAGVLLKDGIGKHRNPIHDFSNNGDGRRLLEVEESSPPGTASVRARLVWENIEGLTQIGFRQVKVESGGLPSSLYTAEGSSVGTIAKITDEAIASVERDNAEALQRSELESKVNLNNQNLNARITQEAETSVNRDNAEAYLRTQLESKVNNNNNDVNARITETARTSAEANSATSQRIDTVSASIITRPNLISDIDTWYLQPPCFVSVDGWGRTLRAFNPQNGTYVCTSPRVPCYAGQTYVITGDSLLYSTGGRVWLDITFVDGAGNWLSDSPHNAIDTYHDHSSTNSNRIAHQAQGVAPPGAAMMFARFVAFEVVNCTAFGVRQVKVEQGTLPATTYSQENAVMALGAAVQNETIARVDGDKLLAAQITTVQATTAARPNICSNVDKWALGSGMYVTQDSWGLHTQVNNPGNGTFVCNSPKFPVGVGAEYIVAGDSLLLFHAGGSGFCYFDIIYFNDAGVVVGDSSENAISAAHDFDATGTNRRIHSVSSIAPPGATEAIARFVAQLNNCAHTGFRQVKVERGSMPASNYSAEGETRSIVASVQQEAQVRSEQTGHILAHNSIKIDIDGWMTGYGLIAESNQGVNSSTFAVRADRFYVGQGNSSVLPFLIEGNNTYINNVIVKDASIGRAKIADLAVDNAKIASLDAAKINTGYLSADRIAAQSIDVNKLAADSVNAEKIQANAIKAHHVEAKSIGAEKINVGSLAALTANLGDITAGIIRNPSSTNYVNLNAQGGDWAACFGGGKFFATADGHVEMDMVNIKRRPLATQGTTFWGIELLWNSEEQRWNHDLNNLYFVIDTGLNIGDGGNFSAVQPFYAIASCTNAETSGGGTGWTTNFELTISCQVGIGFAHSPNSAGNPSSTPYLRIIARPIINYTHPNVWRIKLNNITWSLFKI